MRASLSTKGIMRLFMSPDETKRMFGRPLGKTTRVHIKNVNPGVIEVHPDREGRLKVYQPSETEKGYGVISGTGSFYHLPKCKRIAQPVETEWKGQTITVTFPECFLNSLPESNVIKQTVVVKDPFIAARDDLTAALDLIKEAVEALDHFGASVHFVTDDDGGLIDVQLDIKGLYNQGEVITLAPDKQAEG